MLQEAKPQTQKKPSSNTIDISMCAHGWVSYRAVGKGRGVPGEDDCLSFGGSKKAKMQYMNSEKLMYRAVNSYAPQFWKTILTVLMTSTNQISDIGQCPRFFT